MNGTKRVAGVIAAAIGAVLASGTAAAAGGHAGTGWGSSTSSQPTSWGTHQPFVVAYGDSVAHESINAIRAAVGGRVHLAFRMAGGTGICDWLAQMRTDATTHPALAVLEFGGNLRPCDTTSNPEVAYQQDATEAVRIFRAQGTRVVLVNGPQGSPSGMAPWYGGTPVDAAYAATAANVPGTLVDTAPAQAVAPGHRFTQYLPCMPGETAAQGCLPYYGGIIQVRAIDGVHLCPAGYPGDSGVCGTYSSGEVRYGRAVAAEILAIA